MTAMALLTFLATSHGQSYGDIADSDELGLTAEQVQHLVAAGIVTTEVVAEPEPPVEAPARGRSPKQDAGPVVEPESTIVAD